MAKSERKIELLRPYYPTEIADDDMEIDIKVIQMCQSYIHERHIDEKNQLRLWLEIPAELRNIVLGYSMLSDRILFTGPSTWKSPSTLGGLQLKKISTDDPNRGYSKSKSNVMYITFSTDQFAVENRERNPVTGKNEAVKVGLQLKSRFSRIFEALKTPDTEKLVSMWMNDAQIEKHIQEHPALISLLPRIADDLLEFVTWV